MADAKIWCAFTLSKLYLNYCVGTPKMVRIGSGYMRSFAGNLNMLSSQRSALGFLARQLTCDSLSPGI